MLLADTAMLEVATFGPFELDTEKRELRKHGIRLRLPDQSFEILALLAERAGQVITREEIRERLWPGGTVVEFEHSINSAVKRLRDALGDSAAKPRFVETVARRGYVFIAPTQHPDGEQHGARFRLLEEAGRGAMGLVYRAEDQRLGRPVALKFLPDQLAGDRSALEQLRREARTAAALNHPNICTLYGLEEHEGRPCLVMEFLEGRPLSRLIEAGPLPSDQAIDFAIQACRALEAAHARGIIHRDLKPANLFVTGSGQVKLTDFGIAMRAGEAGSPHEGTPSYMSPEQERGEALDGRSDIFSLGMVLHEIVTGRRARERGEAERPAAGVPEGWRKAIAECVQERPADRFQTAADLRAALESLKQETKPPGRRAARWIAASAAAAVVIAGAAILWTPGVFAPHRAAIRSIAVLPLENLSGDAAQEYFADGMTEQLITALAQIKGWEVISRTSVMRYKGARQPLQEIARTLGADGVIEGTVLRSGSRVRITAQLIDAARDRHLWSGSFERDLSDVLALQDGVAQTIAGELKLTLSPRQQARLRVPRKIVPEAYDAYLRGWYFFDRAQYEKAAAYFEQATRADPGFALAHALLGESAGMAAFALDQPPPERTLRAAETARQLDDGLAEVHDLLGDAMAANWDLGGAVKEYRRAVELDPGSVDAAFHYAIGLRALTRWDAAEQELRRALRLDPVSPLLNVQLLALFVDTHRYDAAVEQFRKVIELDPNSAAAYSEIATVYAAAGRERDAAAAFLRAESLSGIGDERLTELAAAAERGYSACVRKKIDQLEEKAQSGRVSPYVMAGMYAQIGEKDKALTLLEQAYREHLARMFWLKARATWDPIRGETRFQALIRQMRFPE